MEEVWEGQHEVVVDAPAKATVGVSSQKGRQEVCKGPGTSLLIGYTELVQSLHQGGHHLHTHSIAFVAQQVQECPTEQISCWECEHTHVQLMAGSMTSGGFFENS